MAGRNEFESFDKYIEFVKERIVFEKMNDDSEVQVIGLSNELMGYYFNYEKYFRSIEYLTVIVFY